MVVVEIPKRIVRVFRPEGPSAVYPYPPHLEARASKLKIFSQESWENCDENTKVPYEPMCNQFISHMMDPLRDVVYDPHAHDLVEGMYMYV